MALPSAAEAATTSAAAASACAGRCDFLPTSSISSEAQVTELATILAELKTERAQAAVDDRRATSALAEVIAAEAFDEAKAKGATGDRVKSAERVEAAVAKALGQIHALLEPEQRAKLAYLLRTGALSI